MAGTDHVVAKQPFARFVFNEAGTLVFLLLALGFVMEAQDFTGKGGEFPLLVGYLTLALIFFELVSKILASFLRNRNTTTKVGKVTFRLFLAFVFLFGIVGSIYAFGVILGAVIGVSSYYLIHERMSLWVGVSLGAATGFFAWLIFEKLAGFSLFSGAFL